MMCMESMGCNPFIHSDVNLSVRYWLQENYGTWHWDDWNEYTQNIQDHFLEKFG